MTDAPKTDYKDTVFLPQTAFPMKAGLPQKEPAILAKWQGENLYAKLRDARRGREKFILHDGPPYANGDIHIGHALNKVLKDAVVRTQTLLGKDAPYIPGWDCHGLPIEWKIEEAYRKKKKNKDEVPIKEFRAECRAYAAEWVDVQREQFKRLGILGDWDNPYLTMAFDAEGTIVSELMKFAESGQLYRGAKPVMWSPVEKTALAEAEVEYEDITSTQIDVAFEIVESAIPEMVGAHAVIWTTTPWTIPVNQALAYGPDVEYRLIEWDDDGIERRTLIAWELWPKFSERTGASAMKEVSSAGEPQSHVKIGKPILGKHLAGTVARHPMHHLGGFFAKPRPFLPGDFVTTDAGTGLVHMAPDHGEDDFELCKANGLNPVFAVEGDGRYRDDWLWLGGDDERRGSVINPKFNAPDGPICSDLREVGALLAASADFSHSYPHSWRSKAKVIFRATPQWFIPMDKPLPPLPFRGGAGGGVHQSDAALADTLHPNPSPEGEGLSLRQTAMQAIADTRFVPEKGRNRIGSMVEGRPDWVISRQRAWGVPITLFVDKKSGEYLVDPAVNARIVEAVKAEGVDAWSDERAQEYLGDAYNADDYERVTDILDVWFDSGCTHVFTLESGKWGDVKWPADLYLEGSDQHRGWFQSSLLESCGTRGRAPYDAVLTHGFTMDKAGKKMSKSLGNTVDPLKIMETSGADIIRMWALSVDYTEDHRIGDEILKGVGDQYRKLRNTFRYMLGALADFDESERVAVSDMPELERYVLGLLADMDAKLKQAVNDFDFNTYTRLLSDFANEDLSAFFFDIRKDRLYCDVNLESGYETAERKAYRSALDIIFHAMVRYAAPVLVFTAEEVWQSRFPDAESVHLLEWPEVDGGWVDAALAAKWINIRKARQAVTYEIEKLRRDKTVGSSLEVDLTYSGFSQLGLSDEELAEVCIVSVAKEVPKLLTLANVATLDSTDLKGLFATVSKTENHKCGRCWRFLPEVEEDGALCGRCEDVLAKTGADA